MKFLIRLTVTAMLALGVAGAHAMDNSANAQFLQVDFLVNFALDSNAGTGFGNPFGIFDEAAEPVLTGQAVFDLSGATIPTTGVSEIGNFSALAHSFSFQTGSQNWTLGDVVVDGILGDPPFDADQVTFLSGDFLGFLISLQDGDASGVLAIDNTFSINNGAGDFSFCNGCVTFSTTDLDELPPVSEVPVPATLPLVLAAFAGLGLAGYRKRRPA